MFQTASNFCAMSPFRITVVIHPHSLLGRHNKYRKGSFCDPGHDVHVPKNRTGHIHRAVPSNEGLDVIGIDCIFNSHHPNLKIHSVKKGLLCFRSSYESYRLSVDANSSMVDWSWNTVWGLFCSRSSDDIFLAK